MFSKARVVVGALALLQTLVGIPGPAFAIDLGSAHVARLPPPPVRSTLILVSIDGFRADYLDRGLTPALASLATGGVRSIGMRPSFPSSTFPNHFTLVTGLYPDHHGVVGNVMDDPAIMPDSHFTVSDFTAVSDPRWWAAAEPLWITCKRQGVGSATMFWPGSEAPSGGLRPDEWAHFDSAITPDQRVDIVLDWLDLPPTKRPGFVTLYFDQVDRAGHLAGPDGVAVNDALVVVDRAVARLVAGLERRGLAQATNLVIVADHGMASTSRDRVVEVDDWAPLSHEHAQISATLAGFDPADARTQAAILAAHAHARCHRREDIPVALHFGANPRVAPIVCMADVGWVFSTYAAAHNPDFALGQHGYDGADPSMAALFIAHGPAFRHGVVLPAFDNVDVYPLLALALHITPRPNDGRLDVVGRALAPPPPMRP